METPTIQTADNQPITIDDLVTVEGIVAANPEALTVAAVRWQLRYRHENGLHACCVKVGKRVLISRRRYEQWLATRAGV